MRHDRQLPDCPIEGEKPRKPWSLQCHRSKMDSQSAGSLSWPFLSVVVLLLPLEAFGIFRVYQFCSLWFGTTYWYLLSGWGLARLAWLVTRMQGQLRSKRRPRKPQKTHASENNNGAFYSDPLHRTAIPTVLPHGGSCNTLTVDGTPEANPKPR